MTIPVDVAVPMTDLVPVLDAEAEVARIGAAMVAALSRRLHRRGVVLGVSGGVDSAVCAALAARAVGPDKVLALLMPERDSSDDSTLRGRDLCERLGIPYVLENITGPLEAAGAYSRRDEAIRRLVPEYGEDWRQKIALASDPLGGARIAYFDLVVESPEGVRQKARMPADVYRQVVAATNMKQRIRKLTEYYHAERLNHAVLGTPNRLEYELGFFVRGGDGLADLKPIAHLYKTQVYALAEALDIPEAIRSQPPSTDTYSLEQTQDEFYFALAWQDMDRLLAARRRGMTAAETAGVMGLEAGQVEQVWRDCDGKRRMAARSLADAITVDPLDLEG